MKRLDLPELVPFLIETEFAKQQLGEFNNARNAVMVIPHKGVTLRVIAAKGPSWDHVSVSLHNRTPTWYELEYIRKLLFNDNEVVVQFHVPSKDHVNIHPNCLHLWHWRGGKFPMPPKSYV